MNTAKYGHESMNTAKEVAVLDKKLAVLEELRARSEALRLPELLALLPWGFAERSVRRWLSELENEGRVVKTGRKRGTRYRALADSSSDSPEAGQSATARTLETPEPIRFSPAAQAAAAYVSQPLFQRAPVAYDADWLAAYEPNRTAYFPAGQAARLAEEGRRAPVGDPAGTYARRIYDRLLIDLSHHSSRLEGNTYSLLDTERLLLEGRPADGKLDLETVMILNHKEAIRHLVEQSVPRGVSYDEILTLHYLLSDALVASEHSGAVRDHGVRVSGSAYIPLEDRSRLERQLRTVAEKAAAIADPYEQSLFLLVHVTYLQAFADVNKRTARLCANLPLLRHNLVPLSFNAVDKDDYATAVISIYERKAPQPMAELYAASYLRTCAQYDATVEASGFDAVRVRYRQQRREAVAGIVADVAIGEALAERIRAVAAGVAAEDRQAFVEDLHEDLAALSPARIAGLGVSVRQLRVWLAAQPEATAAPHRGKTQSTP